MRHEDLISHLGGWDNLMQGLGGAVITGIVAALTAWAVLAGTRRHERRLADELDARRAAREMMNALTDAGLGFDEAEKDKDTEALARLTIRMSGYVLSYLPALEQVDPEFVTNRLRPFLTTIIEFLKELSTSADPWSVAIRSQRQGLATNIGNANNLLSGWLARRHKRRNRRAYARVPAQAQDRHSGTIGPRS